MESVDAKKEKALQDFFQHNVCTEEFALYLRRLNYETIRMVLRLQDEDYNKEWIDNGHYWLNAFCEIIDPQLEKSEH